MSDAVGALEMFEAVWEEGKMALLGPNGRFMTVDEEDSVVCDKHKVGETEIIRIRSNKEREDLNKKVSFFKIPLFPMFYFLKKLSRLYQPKKRELWGRWSLIMSRNSKSFKITRLSSIKITAGLS